MSTKYQPTVIEPKWQEKWRQDQLYKTDLSDAAKKFYLLIEFPYPSGDLHIGHWFTFAVPDMMARLKRMQGYNVFMPMGYDSFGLPAENAAIKRGVDPESWTNQNIASMNQQYKLIGGTHDHDHAVIASSPEYYKWNQWIFIKLYERGLAYKDKFLSNWCPSCQTVLANEAVEAGKCWRCGTEVIQKEIEQWFLKITDYADRLIWDSENPAVDWPKSVIDGQNNWIGKSEGINITFQVAGSDKELTVYTVYPETIYGVTYLVIAPEHPLADKLVTDDYKEAASKYIEQSKRKSEIERKTVEKDKTGVNTGSFVINPVNGQKVPVWIADYVIASYGTGAVMGVPASDHRDYAFAAKYDLPIKRVVGKSPDDTSDVQSEKDVLEEGILVNSGQFDGLTTPEPAREKIKDHLEENNWGKRQVQYHLHDWSISRQRYWGTPVPMLNCQDCGVVPVPEDQLPVILPKGVDYAPKGVPPLATAPDEWLYTDCPKCGGRAKREVETLDTFFDSSWYFFRFLDHQNSEKVFDPEIVKEWMPVDIYFGGAEHTLGHTLYSRFFTKFFYDLGLVPFEEYALKRVNHGVILGPDGARMSKSKGNVINPDEQVAKYGADAVRLYLAFIGPYDVVAPWNPDGMNGVYHFLERVWGLLDKVTDVDPTKDDLIQMNQAVNKVTEDLANTKFNTAVATMMGWLNYLSKKDKVSSEEYKKYLTTLAPMAPHISEELWSMLGEGYSIHQQSWPTVDPKYLEEDSFKVAVQINGKVRELLEVGVDIVSSESDVVNLAKNSPKVQKYIDGVEIKKTIYVRGKILNLVV